MDEISERDINKAAQYILQAIAMGDIISNARLEQICNFCFNLRGLGWIDQITTALGIGFDTLPELFQAVSCLLHHDPIEGVRTLANVLDVHEGRLRANHLRFGSPLVFSDGTSPRVLTILSGPSSGEDEASEDEESSEDEEPFSEEPSDDDEIANKGSFSEEPLDLLVEEPSSSKHAPAKANNGKPKHNSTSSPHLGTNTNARKEQHPRQKVKEGRRLTRAESKGKKAGNNKKRAPEESMRPTSNKKQKTDGRFNCPTCGRSFGAETALKQHRCDKHQR